MSAAAKETFEKHKLEEVDGTQSDGDHNVTEKAMGEDEDFVDIEGSVVKDEVVAGAGGDDKVSSTEKPVRDEWQEEEEDPDGWLDLLGSGRIRKRTLVPGGGGDRERGERPRQGYPCTLRLTVFFQDLECISEEELFFIQGESEVMQAIDLVVAVMEHGEKAEVIADPEFAYGSQGLPDRGIPSNAAVRLVLTLVDFSSEPLDLTELDVEQKMVHGRRKKDRGNDWYAREQFRSAIQCYRKAVEFFDDEQLELDVPVDRFALSANLQELLVERIKTYNNLAQSQMKIEAYDAALTSLKQVLKIDPNNEKALYRKSRVLQEKLCSEEAIGILRRIQRLYPENKLARADLAKLTAKQKKNREAEERMSKKMLGLDKYEEEKKQESHWKKLAVTSALALGGLGALMGAVAVAYKFRVM